MDDAKLALMFARGRMALGALMVIAPARATRMFFGRSEAGGVEPQLTRMVGARDLALGLGTVIALDKGTPVRGWLEASAFADAGDGVATLLGRRQMSQNAFTGTIVLVVASAAAGLLLGKRLDPAPAAHPGQPEAAVTGHHE
jgi:hypothetical protein